MDKLKKANKLVEKADYDDLLLMAGFLFDKQFIRGHIYASLKLASEKQMDDFITMFSDIKIEKYLNK